MGVFVGRSLKTVRCLLLFLGTMKLLLLVSALLAVAQASHFRYGTISWEPFEPTTVQFRVDTAWKRSYWPGSGLAAAGQKTDACVVGGRPCVAKNDVFEVPEGTKGNYFYFGDGTDSALLRVEVTSPAEIEDRNGVANKDYEDDQALGISQGPELKHFYPSAGPGTIDSS